MAAKVAPEQPHSSSPTRCPFRSRSGFSRVCSIFAVKGLHELVTFIGGGKLGLPDKAVVAFDLGCDMVNVAREAMLAIGCIQAQKCHTETCPTGVATLGPPTLRAVSDAGLAGTGKAPWLSVSSVCELEMVTKV